MNKLKVLIITLATAGMMASCSLTLPVAATSNPIGSKVGTATASGFFQVLFFGADASIQTAAKNAGITKISTVDIKQTSLLGILVSYETIVTGE